MTATRTTPETPETRAAGTRAAGTIRPVPFRRLLDVELRKMVDTRAAFWLLAAVVLLALLVSVALAAFGRDDEIHLETFTDAVAFLMVLVLPMVAVMSVTSEWSQRGALTTFVLVPRRGRVVAGKAVAGLVVGVAATAVAIALCAGANAAAAAARGLDPVWDLSLAEGLRLVLLQLVAVAVGFMVGVVLRRTPPALVLYLAWAAVWPTLFGMVAGYWAWLGEHAAWLDLGTAMNVLYAESVAGEQWAQLAVATALWVVLPTALGMRRLLRVEIK